MPSWIKKTLIGLFGASILVGGLTACSGGHHHRHGPMDAERMAEVRGKVMERIGSKLDLNEAQKQKLATLADKLQAQRAAFVARQFDPRAEVQALVAGEVRPRPRAQALIDERSCAPCRPAAPGADRHGRLLRQPEPEQQQKVRDYAAPPGWMGRHG